MKIFGRDLTVTVHNYDTISISFKCDTNAMDNLLRLEREDYVVEISKPKNKRTLNQNAMLWELIGQIDMKENGSRADDESIYKVILKMAGQGIEYLQGLPEAKTTLEKFYRIVDVVDERTNEKGTLTCVYRCFKGISQMSTIEMSSVIDNALIYAKNVGISTDYYEEHLR